MTVSCNLTLANNGNGAQLTLNLTNGQLAVSIPKGGSTVTPSEAEVILGLSEVLLTAAKNGVS